MVRVSQSEIEESKRSFFKKKKKTDTPKFDTADPVERMRHAFDTGDGKQDDDNDDLLAHIRTAGY